MRTITLFMAILALAACQDPGPPAVNEKAGEPPGTPIKVVGSSMEFDPATVMLGSAGAGWGLGSYNVFVLGRVDGQCVFRYFDEEEGGYASYLCRVPVDGPPVRIYEDNGGIGRSFDVTKAKVLLRGNVHLGPEQPAPPPVKWKSLSVGDTGFAVSTADVSPGKGATPAKGKRVTLHVTVYADETLALPLVGLEMGKTLEFTLGDGTAGPSVKKAVEGMQVGGTRLAMIREEVAGILNAAFGPFNPETRFTVKMELKAVK